jgi:hypothetical protein
LEFNKTLQTQISKLSIENDILKDANKGALNMIGNVTK